jgi:hypothetical protein
MSSKGPNEYIKGIMRVSSQQIENVCCYSKVKKNLAGKDIFENVERVHIRSQNKNKFLFSFFFFRQHLFFQFTALVFLSLNCI